VYMRPSAHTARQAFFYLSERRGGRAMFGQERLPLYISDMKRVYLDHTATTPLDPLVYAAMRPYFLEHFGNASSIHHFGREARAALDGSRESIARQIGAKAGELFFVGSGTEADNTAIKGVAMSLKKSSGKAHIIASSVEHHAVLEPCKFLREYGFTVTFLPVDGQGMVNPDDVARAIRSDTALISVMHANNEVGTIQPISEIAALAHEHGILVHSDAVQTFGKIPLTADALGVDLVSISAHKIYGPKGIGAFYLRRGVMLERLIHGGGQERGRRAGTESVPLAVGFAKAAALMEDLSTQENARLHELSARLRSMLQERFQTLLFNGHPDRSLPHIVNVSFDSRRIAIDGEALLFNLDMAGVAVTSGSACTSGSIEPSHVLLAMGRSQDTARATIRFSLGRSTTMDDIEYTVTALQSIVTRIGKPVHSTV
jgi:cysteine desulfurase